jgi:hypothetical protein
MTDKNALAAMSALLSLLLASTGSAEEPRRKGPWPIRDGRNYQPTEQALRAMNWHDLLPEQAREVDRLYDELLVNSEKDFTRYSESKH